MLPKEYQEVEWLGSTGTQYFNTGVSLDKDLVITCDYSFTESQNVWRRLFGWSVTGWADSYSFCYKTNRIKAPRIVTGPNGEVVLGDYQTGRYTVSLSTNGHVSVYGDNGYNQSRDITPCTVTSKSRPIYLYNFGSTNLVDYAACKVYSFSISSTNDVAMCSLVPCYRKYDEKPGMYDTVRKIFLTNQGTGEFICGPAVYNALLRETNGLEMGHRRELLAWQMYKKSKGPIYKINPPIGITDTEHAFFSDGDRDLTVLLAHQNPNISTPTSHTWHGNATVLYDTTSDNYKSFMGVSLVCLNGLPYIICGFAEDGYYAYNSYNESSDMKLYAPYPTRFVWRHKKGTKTATLKHQIVDSENTFNVTSRGRKDFYPCTTTLKIRSLTNCVVTEVLVYDRILTDAEERMYIRNGIAP